MQSGRPELEILKRGFTGEEAHGKMVIFKVLLGV